MIFVAGSVNQDLVSYVPQVPRAGETVTGQGFRMFPGGKGANQAVAVARVGREVKMLARVGEDVFGTSLVKNLQVNGVDTQMVAAVPGAATGTAVIMVEENGENRIVLDPGANAHLAPADVDRLRSDLTPSSLLLLQLEIPMAAVEAAAKAGREAGATVILDPAPLQSLSTDLLKCVDILTPNQTELMAAAGLSGADDPEACVGAARLLLARGAKRVVVKMGGQGCLMVEAGEVALVEPYRVTVVDTTGAGDAFNGGLAAALAAGRPFLEACRFANAVGALTVTKQGAQSAMPTLPEVEALMAAQGGVAWRRLAS